ncbi:hypothetical protein [Marinagarivorans algicola]|uniref:hypothetical protein n=1 Tax=Marinagarivorans algicola TaxID=1513270 RepID=UPI003736C77C
MGGEPKEVLVSIGGYDYLIPKDFFYNSEDLSGGAQEVVTLSFFVDQDVKAVYDSFKEGLLGVRVFLYSNYKSPNKKRNSLLNNFSSVVMQNVDGVGEVYSVDGIDFKYVFMSTESGPLFLSCLNFNGDFGAAECQVYSSSQSASVSFSFSFSKGLKLPIKELEMLVIKTLKGFKKD